MGMRVAFSYERPIIVSSCELVYGGKRFGQGAPFPWMDLGVSREQLWELWQTFTVDCAVTTQTASKPTGQRQPNQKR